MVAEWYQIKDGKIVHVESAFDGRPFAGMFAGGSQAQVEPLDLCYTFGYTVSMKTAISLPDNLFEAADKMARRLGISRSELYQRAVARFLEQHSGDVVRAALDAVYGKPENRRLDPLIEAAGEHILSDEDW